ncbi:Stk1 family PASTA domain-containing Ser/Thr kinase [Bariatricus massiliensis]|uniref:non-specific serine/threonine protein kinase n=1 Tax=Bariatricus massiliensis TaxID=1745713 RepID=A0ABS8DE22_9FIRM|nr:Stk1 family PASTA domain-containing Ser/Thr kinase [Bariatricus massiliensis]MCB7302787.1 Stk1 family PASTA domain-containing Ser/Thr kinase [Bariatricus massiliensis]MCB7374003.1 Stk1 family PASTA domain-containing Ser/Thr kinase [Bariatricus massiliensis]MCB7386673.1 Stk1 family PASTA domain-containing Ser/Thr kinase [Bariatricus massiliensis]MCB7410835.1 Stk1 family PASTA domain-containing Ser/Thr kinase [Bariatricus massiliensis]MCQ5251659.1 Stk1 family PASTA domain-containing Ser/Thr k
MVKDGIYLGERYEVLSKLGAGGMADVYKGKDHMLNRYVAIKVLKKEYREDEDFVKKFRSEAQAAAGLMNPNIVNVYDVGEDRGLYYMVMELVEGITLKEYIQKKGRLSTKEVISISIQMCTGIEAAHRHHIIHRDIKPQNIIISKEGKVKVTDFGIARAVNSNTISSNAMGSVHYVSPEQARGGFCDMKSDIYSAGITIYEMVTGKVPFDGDSTVAVAMKHLQEIITPPSEFAPDMSPALEKIILKCTQKSPDRRYQDVSLLIQDLKRALVDPDGDFVDTVPIRSIGDTVMISSEEMSRIKRGYGDEYDDDGYDDDEYDDEDYDDEYDDEYDDDEYDDEDYDDYDGRENRKKSKSDEMNPRMNKMMKILTIVVAVIIVFVLIFIIGKAAGVFKFPSATTQETTTGKVEVPKLVGETEVVAKQMCEKKNLVMKVIKKETSDKYDAGYVIEQKTEPGKKVKKKTVIEVVVSSGAEEVQITDVANMSESEAKKALLDQGFEDGNISVQFENSSDVAEGDAIRTNPAAGETVTVDTKITLYISKGAEKKTVPNIVGMKVSDAQSALADAGLADGGISSSDYSDTVPEGQVMSQSVKKGKKVDEGTSVSYTVSKGKKPADTVTVPQITGRTLSEARSMLSNVGLSYTESYVDSDADYGIVVNCDPGVGKKLEVGSTVTLYISNASQAGGGQEPGDNSGTDTQ